jgi:hypothetical protein
MCVCMYVCMYVCVYACMCVCLCVYVSVCLYKQLKNTHFNPTHMFSTEKTDWDEVHAEVGATEAEEGPEGLPCELIPFIIPEL